MPAQPTRFDRAYYERFYHTKATRVLDRSHVEKLGGFVCSYLRYLDVKVKRVLDVGCGIGLWRDVVGAHFPRARYHGVEVSSYLCERYGWERGSVLDYASDEPYDLVICQGVLPYLEARDVKRAVKNLSSLCAGALYLEAVTKEDWDGGVIDKRRTDRAMHFHPARLYRRALSPSFRAVGGGVWVAKTSSVAVYELEAT